MEAFSFCCNVHGVGEFSVRICRLGCYAVSSEALLGILFPSVCRTACHCPGLAFDVALGGVYHCLFSLASLTILVVISALRLLRLCARYYLPCICEVCCGGGIANLDLWRRTPLAFSFFLSLVLKTQLHHSLIRTLGHLIRMWLLQPHCTRRLQCMISSICGLNTGQILCPSRSFVLLASRLCVMDSQHRSRCLASDAGHHCAGKQ